VVNLVIIGAVLFAIVKGYEEVLLLRRIADPVAPRPDFARSRPDARSEFESLDAATARPNTIRCCRAMSLRVARSQNIDR
jgi:hypothetical protein